MDALFSSGIDRIHADVEARVYEKGDQLGNDVEMMFTRSRAKAALDFQLAARRAYSRVCSGEASVHHWTSSSPCDSNRSIKTAAYDERGRRTISQCDFSTSSSMHSVNAGTRKQPPHAPSTSKSQAHPASEHNRATRQHQTTISEESEAKSASDSKLTASLSSSLSSSPTGAERPEIFTLTHFKKPTPVFVRGVRHVSMILRFRRFLESLWLNRPTTQNVGAGHNPLLRPKNQKGKTRLPLGFRLLDVALVIWLGYFVYRLDERGQLDTLRSALGLSKRRTSDDIVNKHAGGDVDGDGKHLDIHDEEAGIREVNVEV